MKLYKAYAKVNIFLKITGARGNYHEIISRFMRVDSLYDELSFVAKNRDDAFKIIGEFSCKTEQNTIYKAYIALLDSLDETPAKSLKNLMDKYAVEVKKNIPAFAGLGGGSSDAATFLKMCNEVLDLGLSQNELALIGLKVGADIPFFIYGYDSANVGGIGEVVEEFKEELLDFEIFTPKIEISTPKVYRAYRENFYNPIDGFKVEKLKKTPSLDILKKMSADEANDLFKPALQEYKELKNYYKYGYYFSGSGSSFFRVKERKQ
ncbi:4-(cytidine 5'-diphospho)-2-C-methyl-D-erythritol kinase [Sulfurimonas xiamenensis]|jgi:4-diphosphocytidyl-2-C-methyl-D-erythritol kinase|uniref:4-diphosphocytidyl-2-C-methyl-D-erythritol kinase n=1 Tax=Sulfurimonas xiamenensis TaxID=2590021 RepID=A0AAJ4A2N9_9BACT|nr:4-(cytidine 5'-diphospho)-2-C-methyl-D-erythritol kinase [Sulfurimonas xiamenensis]QFR42718.1 4-(cytidine 5'-diphospho)-2-C-methyl-D-erythritol kinase [Sulfurimonas xiamenensis]